MRLLPFDIALRSENSRYLSLAPKWHGWDAFLGNGLALLLLLVFFGERRIALRSSLADLILVACTGLYGLIAILLLPPEAEQAQVDVSHDLSDADQKIPA